MGCGESKIKKIHLTNEDDWDIQAEERGSGGTNHARDLWKNAAEKINKQNEVVTELKSNVPIIDVIDKSNNDWTGLDSKGVMPNSLLATIPSSDLGESLDCRPVSEPVKEAVGHTVSR